MMVMMMMRMYHEIVGLDEKTGTRLEFSKQTNK